MKIKLSQLKKNNNFGVGVYGDTATYLHGATDDEYRNVMAPYLLQWQAIKDAKKAGYKFYDFGGVKTEISNSPNYLISNQTQNPNNQIDKNTRYQIPDTSWSGITKFKLGFAPETEPIKFPGSFDLIIKPQKYLPYRLVSQLKKYS
jgi:lipid II:glycine glycyltransferase (peptidoglycan interpeptide bridge formation enzyme)